MPLWIITSSPRLADAPQGSGFCPSIPLSGATSSIRSASTVPGFAFPPLSALSRITIVSWTGGVPVAIIGHFHVAELELHIMERRIANPVLAAQIRPGHDDFRSISPDARAVAVWAETNSRGERIFGPECEWLS